METIFETIQNDICNLVLLNACLGVLMLLNIILGSIMAKASDQFDKKKFFNGLLKALLVCLVMVVFCFILEVLPIIFDRIGFVIPKDLPTYIEVISIVAVAVIKYAKGIIDKLKTLLDVNDQELEEMNNHNLDRGEG